jgi:hypothetical protein
MVDMAELWAEDLTTAPMPGLDTSRTRGARQRLTRRSSPDGRRGLHETGARRPASAQLIKHLTGIAP